MALYLGNDKVKLYLDGAQLSIAKTSYTNQVPISTDADGNIYNDTGFKYGYRVRSGGAEAAQGNAACTGFIPCKVGQTIRVMDASKQSIWYENTTSCAINFSDSSKTNLGQIVGNSSGYGTCAGMGTLDTLVTRDSNNMWEYTVPSSIGDVAYIRLTVYYGHIGENLNLIATVNEEIPV